MLVRIDTLRHIIFIITIYFTIKHGIPVMLIGQAIVMFIMAVINLWYSGRLFNQVLTSTIKYIIPYYTLTLFVLFTTFSLPSLGNDISTIIFKGVIFTFIYLGASTILNLKGQKEIVKIIQDRFVIY